MNLNYKIHAVTVRVFMLQAIAFKNKQVLTCSD